MIEPIATPAFGRSLVSAGHMWRTSEASESPVAGGRRRGQRVLLIGLDAADAGILLGGMESGAFPRLRRMRDDGAWGIVTSPMGFERGDVWRTFATGVSPAKHGRHHRRVGPAGSTAEKFEAEQLAVAPVWEHIARVGRSVAVFDVPHTGVPERNIDGVVASDWISHGPVSSELRTWPAAFRDELTTRFGENPPWNCELSGGRDEEQLPDFVDRLRHRIGQRERATRHYWHQGCDLLMTVFGEPHCVGHQTWHVRDHQHPTHDATTLQQLGDPVEVVYREIDAAIGRIVDDVDDDTTVIVFSVAGTGPSSTGTHLLDDVLRALGRPSPTAFALLTTTARRWLERMLPPVQRRRGEAPKRCGLDGQAYSGDRVDRPSFTVPHDDGVGAIRLNVVGRDPRGVLRCDEVDGYVDQLRTELFALRNAESGDPVVARVIRVSDGQEDEWIGLKPDLLVVWKHDAPIDRVTSDAIGIVECAHRAGRTSDHSPDHVFFAIGPRIVPGQCQGVALHDFASTLCRLVGVPTIPSDGWPIKALTAPVPLASDIDALEPSISP